MSGKRTRNAAEASNKNTSRNSKKRKIQSSEDMGCIGSKPEGEPSTKKDKGQKKKKSTTSQPQDKYQPCGNCSSLEKSNSELQAEVHKYKRESRQLKDDGDKKQADLKSQLDDGDKRYEDLKSQLDSALREAEQHKSAKEQIEKERISTVKANDERYEKTCNKIEELTKKLERAEAKLREKHNEISAVSKKADEKVRSLTDDLRKFKADNERLLNRVSELAGAKLSAGNPNLVDISDENRPTKLAERYGELYDNDWTDAFALLTDSGYDDLKAIDTLLKLLTTIYSECKSYAEEDLKSFNSIIVKSFRYDENSAEAMVLRKQYTDRRKKTYRNLKSDVKPIMDTKLSSILSKAERNSVQKFTEETFDICMLMCVQDPQVYIDNVSDNPDSTFDNTIYKAYTKAGSRIAYVVWPPLYLHKDGPILAKGIAQGQQDNIQKKKAPGKIPDVADEQRGTEANEQKQEMSEKSKQGDTKALTSGQKDKIQKKKAPGKIPDVADDQRGTEANEQKQEMSEKSKQGDIKALTSGQKGFAYTMPSKGTTYNEPARNASKEVRTDGNKGSGKSKREAPKPLKSVINVSVQGIQYQSPATSNGRPKSDAGKRPSAKSSQMNSQTDRAENRHSVPSTTVWKGDSKGTYI